MRESWQPGCVAVDKKRRHRRHGLQCSLNLQKVLFGKSVFAGAGAAATEYNINVSFDGPAAEEDYETQNEMVRRAMDDGVDVIIFSAVDYNANAEIIDQAASREGSRSS